MKTQTFAGLAGTAVGLGMPLLKTAERIIGWASLPSDLRTWRSFLEAVFGAPPVIEWVILGVGGLCLAVALGWEPWALLNPRDKEGERALADKAEELARDLIDEHASYERKTREAHLRERRTKEHWIEAQRLGAELQEAAIRRHGRRLEQTLAEFKRRGLALDAWQQGFSSHDWYTWARALMLAAASVREGTHRGKVLIVNPWEQRIEIRDGSKEDGLRRLAERNAQRQRP